MNIQIIENQILIDSISLLVDHDDVKIFNIDCKSKYADVLATTMGDGTASVLLEASNRTLYLGTRKTPTEVVVPCDTSENWSMMAECSRYTCLFVIFRLDAERPTLWVRGD